MSKVRGIRKVFKSEPTIEGAGVHLTRAFGHRQLPQLDPFLLLDDFHSQNPSEYLPGFPWHPHRGIETITYVLQGKVEHGDSMGNRGIIHPGDVQWMTAGSGIVHQEMPKGQKDGWLWGFQLWANLPAARKMMEPRYREVPADQIPEQKLPGGGKARIICGEVNGVRGPVRDIVIDPEYMDIALPPGTRFHRPVKKGHTLLAYVIEGGGYFDPGRDPFAFEAESSHYCETQKECLMTPETLILYGDGDEIQISTEDRPLRFLLISGKPIREPVAWYGPIVMNTQEELRTAFAEYQQGTFIKGRKVQ